MTATIETFAAAAERQQADTREAYASLVETAAAGDGFDELAAVAVIRAMGKTVAEFESDVSGRQRRRGLLETLDAGRKAGREWSEAKREVDALVAERDARLRQVEAEYAAKIHPVQVRQQEATDRQQAGREAQAELTRTAPDWIKTRLRRLESAVTPRLDNAVRDAEQAVADARQAAGQRKLAGASGWVPDRNVNVADPGRAQARIERAEDQLRQAREAVARNVAEIRLLNAELLSEWPRNGEE